MRKLKLREGTNTAVLFGHHDRHLKLIEEDLGVRLSARGEELTLDGTPDATRHAERVLTELATLANDGMVLQPDDITHALNALRQSPETSIKELLTNAATIVTKKRFVAPKTPTQKAYIEAIETHDIVIGIGPAGTGKTYLAMAMAVAALKNSQVSRIVLTRPILEAGERLGFLPGDMLEKVDPYLRPLYDALQDIMGPDKLQRHRARGTIEVVPLAYMRGRTVNDAFIVLDEAQNTTPSQMKMALTRMGLGSRMIVTGDITQSDLPEGQESGLRHGLNVLGRIKEIEICWLSEADIVRHDLVQRIVLAYEAAEG